MLAAPDKLKGSLGADEAARAIARGVMSADAAAVIDVCPLADGGDGTLAVLVPAMDATFRTARVRDARGRWVDADWAFVDTSRTAIIESARAVGLASLVVEERNPLGCSSFGVGQLVRAALDAGARRILLGLGGSATTDGGVGMAQALGARFEGASDVALGADLERIQSVDVSSVDSRLAEVDLVALCDVTSPLTGPLGAALRFAPQKGASSAVAIRLDVELARLAALVPCVDPEAPGAGAAGGLGFGVLAFLRGRLAAGADFVLDLVGFDERAGRANLVLTAEGRLDAQSLVGKVVGTVARRSPTPVVALVGTLDLGADEVARAGLAGAFSLPTGPMAQVDAERRSAELLADLAARVARTWLSAARS